jgi:hypothetical protein
MIWVRHTQNNKLLDFSHLLLDVFAVHNLHAPDALA